MSDYDSDDSDESARSDDHIDHRDSTLMPRVTENHFDELIDFLQNTSDLGNNAGNALKQAMFAGGGGAAGGLLFGPVGGLVGAITGAIVGFANADDYNGMIGQLMELDDENRERVIRQIFQLLIVAGAAAQRLRSSSGFRSVLNDIAGSTTMRRRILNAITNES